VSLGVPTPTNIHQGTGETSSPRSTAAIAGAATNRPRPVDQCGEPFRPPSRHSTRRGARTDTGRIIVRKEHNWLKASWSTHKALADALDLDEWQRQLFDVRWFEEAKHFDEVWRRRRLSYWVLGWVTILGGLSIPLLVALDTPKWVLASAGFLTAVAGALEAFFGFGQRWRQQRHTAVLIKEEGLKFIELRMPYGDFRTHRDAFPSFIERLEQLNEAQTEEYLARVGQPPGDATRAGRDAQQRAQRS